MSQVQDPAFLARLATLPKWAQDYIAGLLRENRELRNQVAGLSGAGGPADTNVRINHYGIQPDQLLPMNARIAFRLGQYSAAYSGQQVVQVHHTLDHSGVLEVSAPGGADGSLHITPQSSNVVRVRLGEF